MAEFIVNGTWQMHPLHDTELVIDIRQRTDGQQLQRPDRGQAGVDPAQRPGISTALGNAFLVTVRWSREATGEYTGTVRNSGPLSQKSFNSGSPKRTAGRFCYKRFS